MDGEEDPDFIFNQTLQDRENSFISMKSHNSVRSMQVPTIARSNRNSRQLNNDEPVVKMLSGKKDLTMRPSINSGSIVGGMIRPPRPQKMLTDEERREIERFELREGDFRRLLADPIMAKRYDKRINKA